MSNKLAWINDKWITNQSVKLPITDRGVTLSDGIFETIMILKGKPQLLEAHLSRWERSASSLGMASPPTATWLKALINEAIQRISLSQGDGALRLNWSRGTSFVRGIDLPKAEDHQSAHLFWLELNAITPNFKPITAIISKKIQIELEELLFDC